MLVVGVVGGLQQELGHAQAEGQGLIRVRAGCDRREFDAGRTAGGVQEQLSVTADADAPVTQSTHTFFSLSLSHFIDPFSLLPSFSLSISRL